MRRRSFLARCPVCDVCCRCVHFAVGWRAVRRALALSLAEPGPSVGNCERNRNIDNVMISWCKHAYEYLFIMHRWSPMLVYIGGQMTTHAHAVDATSVFVVADACIQTLCACWSCVVPGPPFIVLLRFRLKNIGVEYRNSLCMCVRACERVCVCVSVHTERVA